MRLTAVLVTHFLTTCVVRLVEGVVRTVTVRLGSRGVTTRATAVLAGPYVVAAGTSHTDLCLTTATSFGTNSTLVTVAIHTSQGAGTGLEVGPSITGCVTGLNHRGATASASA